MFGLFARPEKGGVNIERAGEILMLADLEGGTNFFDQNDPNAGRNAIIDVLSEARTRGDLINYIRNNREEQARKEQEAQYNAYAQHIMDEYHMSPDELKHNLRDESLETIKRQAEREGGHILILPSEGSEEAGGLSSRTPDLSSDSEDSEKDSSEQENVGKSYKISDVNALSEGMHQHSDAYNRIIELADACTKEVAEHENDYESESSYNDYWKRASLRQQKGSVIGNASPREAALRDALVDVLRGAGVDVVTDVEKGQRVLDEANGDARMQAQIGGLKKASDFIVSFLKGKTKQRSSKLEIPEIANRLAESAIGHKIKGNTINANELTHSKKRHGMNGTAITEKSIPLRDEDFALMPYIMSAPTRVIKGSMASNGTESVRYEKELSNGIVIIVEREGKFDIEDMENITMWAEKKSATNVTVAQRASHSTSETIVTSEADATKIRKDAENAIRNEEKMRQQKVYHGSGADFNAFDS